MGRTVGTCLTKTSLRNLFFGPCSYRHLVDRIAGRNLRGSLPKIREVTIGTDECDELSV